MSSFGGFAWKESVPLCLVSCDLKSRKRIGIVKGGGMRFFTAPTYTSISSESPVLL